MCILQIKFLISHLWLRYYWGSVLYIVTVQAWGSGGRGLSIGNNTKKSGSKGTKMKK